MSDHETTIVVRWNGEERPDWGYVLRMGGLDADEADDMRDCTCGYGGQHEPRSRTCELNRAKP